MDSFNSNNGDNINLANTPSMETIEGIPINNFEQFMEQNYQYFVDLVKCQMNDQAFDEAHVERLMMREIENLYNSSCEIRDHTVKLINYREEELNKLKRIADLHKKLLLRMD